MPDIAVLFKGTTLIVKHMERRKIDKTDQTDRQTDRQAGKTDRQTDRHRQT